MPPDFAHLAGAAPPMEPSLGQQLKQARTQRGLSLADVAHATRVPLMKLQHLEEDNLAAFGNMAYARSFARIYSGFLDVDVERWVKALPQPVFAGAQDYRYLTNTFGPWVEPLRKRVRVSIHRPQQGPERRRWHALTLFLIVAIGCIMLGNQFLVTGKAFHPSTRQPALIPSSEMRPAVETRTRQPVPASRPKLVSFATPAGLPVDDLGPLPATDSQEANSAARQP